MKVVILLFFIAGVFLIVHALYDEKFKELSNKTKVEYRFVPRSYYDEQLFDNQFQSKVSPIFEEDSQWYARNVGRDIGLDRRKI
jgi:hypothetical protein